MPVYESRCEHCGGVVEFYSSSERRHETPFCCGHRTQKVILTPPMGYVSEIRYTSPIDGRPITTKQARADDLARNGCRPWEGMEQETREAQRRAAYAEQRQDAKLESAVTETLTNMAPEQKQVLGVL